MLDFLCLGCLYANKPLLVLPKLRKSVTRVRLSLNAGLTSHAELATNTRVENKARM